MKRNYMVGRDPSCDIVIYDPSNVISRSHATIRVDGRKYYITDHSTNGTYRNGIKLAPNVEYPITKDDDVSLGGVCTLDWGLIPKSQRSVGAGFLYPLAVLLLAALVIGAIYLMPNFRGKPAAGGGGIGNVPVPSSIPKDTVVASHQAGSQVVLEDKRKKPKKKSAVRNQNQAAKKAGAASEPVSKKNVTDYSDDDDRQDVDAL